MASQNSPRLLKNGYQCHTNCSIIRRGSETFKSFYKFIIALALKLDKGETTTKGNCTLIFSVNIDANLQQSIAM